MAPRVSVVMATFNGEQYLTQQLESLLRQTLLPHEVIVSDDNSSDGTIDIAREILSRSGINCDVFVNPQNLGFRENFMSAAARASGDLIAFCDQDDIWMPKKLEICSAYLEDPDVSLVAHTAITVDAAGNRIGEFRQGIETTRKLAPLTLDPWGTYWGFSCVFKRSLLNICAPSRRFVDYIDPRHLIAHDRWVTFLGQMVGAIVEIEEPLAEYRQHSANVFGAGGRSRHSRSQAERSAIYLRATEGMRKVVEELPAEIVGFPLYDRSRCTAFVEQALAQLRARDRIYHSSSRFRSLVALFEALVAGRYRAVNGGRMRWRSIGADLRFVVADTPAP